VPRSSRIQVYKPYRFGPVFSDGGDLARSEKDFIIPDDLPFMPDFEKWGDRYLFDRVFAKHGFGTQDDHK
jgi:hypothetical protein